MCRTVHALLQTIICGVQMLVRVFMTIILMLENLIRMILQTLYNFISFMLQMLSLIPICVVFLLTARLKCFMCGGGGPCPVNRGGTCDCLMSAIAIVIVFFIFRATGLLDKIFYRLGYAKALGVTKFTPTPGDITECSRNDTFTPLEVPTTTELPEYYYDFEYDTNQTTTEIVADGFAATTPTVTINLSEMNSASIALSNITGANETVSYEASSRATNPIGTNRRNMMTTILYYLA